MALPQPSCSVLAVAPLSRGNLRRHEASAGFEPIRFPHSPPDVAPGAGRVLSKAPRWREQQGIWAAETAVREHEEGVVEAARRILVQEQQSFELGLASAREAVQVIAQIANLEHQETVARAHQAVHAVAALSQLQATEAAEAAGMQAQEFREQVSTAAHEHCAAQGAQHAHQLPLVEQRAALDGSELLTEAGQWHASVQQTEAAEAARHLSERKRLDAARLASEEARLIEQRAAERRQATQAEQLAAQERELRKLPE